MHYARITRESEKRFSCLSLVICFFHPSSHHTRTRMHASSPRFLQELGQSGMGRGLAPLVAVFANHRSVSAIFKRLSTKILLMTYTVVGIQVILAVLGILL